MFYLMYHLYREYFPLIALTTYAKVMAEKQSARSQVRNAAAASDECVRGYAFRWCLHAHADKLSRVLRTAFEGFCHRRDRISGQLMWLAFWRTRERICGLLVRPTSDLRNLRRSEGGDRVTGDLRDAGVD